ncbi:MAG: Ribosomal RNA small subunit methyltransferase H [Parcubacteria group bacterium ADurb.Bin316]|nr:MAG: Ribosomal RNA small subunit methyltransferase H [Parcubacteria group bacterium ADurb.Bin316]HOZ56284.1 16S rRNA (cytosine(1402)-N(4))-methyltransferase RsmH [bacterium]
MEYRHTPVMLDEAIEFLHPKPGGNFVDCTLGGGGYTEAILNKIGRTGKIIAFDADPLAIANAQKKFKNKNNVIIIHDNFSNFHKNISQLYPSAPNLLFDGIVFDLGLSSAQLEDRHRGFSFQFDAPLDMVFGEGTNRNRTVAIVNSWSEDEIARAIKDYGEERYARLIARQIVKIRKEKDVTTTGDLLSIISAAVPASYRNNKRLHFATRTFQALRIATNDEMENLKHVLPQALNLLKPGGRLIVVSYHSLEDRIVKIFFKTESQDCICPPQSPTCRCHHRAGLKIITKKPLLPSEEEVSVNPRARSAKLRVAEKIQIK